mmetsp:Transcript_20250/g.37594  ORF Transcript_20250/g.37594 Transcript_20250/m.37594 type:complete len:88 (+) Transcript_20250:938-1201(+)
MALNRCDVSDMGRGPLNRLCASDSFNIAGCGVAVVLYNGSTRPDKPLPVTCSTVRLCMDHTHGGMEPDSVLNNNTPDNGIFTVCLQS